MTSGHMDLTASNILRDLLSIRLQWMRERYDDCAHAFAVSCGCSGAVLKSLQALGSVTMCKMCALCKLMPVPVATTTPAGSLGGWAYNSATPYDAVSRKLEIRIYRDRMLRFSKCCHALHTHGCLSLACLLLHIGTGQRQLDR